MGDKICWAKRKLRWIFHPEEKHKHANQINPLFLKFRTRMWGSLHEAKEQVKREARVDTLSSSDVLKELCRASIPTFALIHEDWRATQHYWNSPSYFHSMYVCTQLTMHLSSKKSQNDRTTDKHNIVFSSKVICSRKYLILQSDLLGTFSPKYNLWMILILEDFVQFKTSQKGSSEAVSVGWVEVWKIWRKKNIFQEKILHFNKRFYI